jgi:hypothetical protein
MNADDTAQPLEIIERRIASSFPAFAGSLRRCERSANRLFGPILEEARIPSRSLHIKPRPLRASPGRSMAGHRRYGKRWDTALHLYKDLPQRHVIALLTPKP